MINIRFDLLFDDLIDRGELGLGEVVVFVEVRETEEVLVVVHITNDFQ